MPDTASVDEKGRCAACGALALNYARVQWGALPGRTYKLGDAIQWLRDAAGEFLPSFTLHKVGPNSWQWNCGYPAFDNVILFDCDVYAGNQGGTCPACAIHIAASVVYIESGRVREVLAFSDADVERVLGPSRGKADIVIVRPDGTHWPREDWYDHAVCST